MPVRDIPSRERTTRNRSIAFLARTSLWRSGMSTPAALSVPVSPPLPARPRPPPRPVTLADRVARAFAPLACVRGFRYYASERVDLVTVSDAAIDASVKGKRLQHVRLRIEEGRLASACTCCAKLMGPAACKHVWATLLEVDRRGAFESLRTTPRVLSLSALDATPRKGSAAPPKGHRSKRGGQPSPQSLPASAAPPAARGRPRNTRQRS